MKKQILLATVLFSNFIFSQIGIRTTNPSATLDIVSTGNTNATKALEINNSSSTEMVTILDNGNMGIGNAAPAAKLDINNGTTAGAIKIVDGTQGAGRVLTSDADGVGTWSPTPATALYFLSSSPYTGSTDFSGTINPVTGANTSASNTRFLSTGTATNLGPTTVFTSGSAGLSYRIPVTGIYRLTLYVDQVPTGLYMVMSFYRNGSVLKYNSDAGNGSPLVMINIWSMEAGDYVVPSSLSVASVTGMYETTFTVERVN